MGTRLKPLEEGRFGRRGSVSAAVWRKMSANLEAMELTSEIPPAKVDIYIQMYHDISSTVIMPRQFDK